MWVGLIQSAEQVTGQNGRGRCLLRLPLDLSSNLSVSLGLRSVSQAPCRLTSFTISWPTSLNSIRLESPTWHALIQFSSTHFVEIDWPYNICLCSALSPEDTQQNKIRISNIKSSLVYPGDPNKSASTVSSRGELSGVHSKFSLQSMDGKTVPHKGRD